MPPVHVNHDVIEEGGEGGQGCNDVGVGRPFQGIKGVSLGLLACNPGGAQPG